MTPQQIDAMKLALEALEGLKSLYGGKGHKLHEINMIHRNHDTAITALEKALAEHAMRETQRLGQEIEQEPVMWSDYESNGMHHKPVAWMDADGNVSDNNDHKCFPIPLYTHPPQRTWVGLTKQQQLDIFAQSVAKKRSEHEHYMAIEQALKERNQ